MLNSFAGLRHAIRWLGRRLVTFGGWLWRTLSGMWRGMGAILRWVAREPKKEPIGTLGALVAVWLTWHTHCRGPDVKLVFGAEAFLIGYDRVGALCVFFNSGSRPAVISGLTAKDDTGGLLSADLLSVGADQFALVAGRRRYVSWATYQYFRPITIKPGEQATELVWFNGGSTIVDKGRPGTGKRFIISAHSPDGVAAERGLEFVVDGEVLECLRHSEAEWRGSAQRRVQQAPRSGDTGSPPAEPQSTEGARGASGPLQAEGSDLPAAPGAELRYLECPVRVASQRIVR